MGIWGVVFHFEITLLKGGTLGGITLSLNNLNNWGTWGVALEDETLPSLAADDLSSQEHHCRGEN